MILPKGEGNIPITPGYLIPIGEESPVKSTIRDLKDVNPSGAIEFVSRACECAICGRSPAPHASHIPAQETIGDHQTKRTSR